MKPLEILEQLSNAYGPPGYEDEVRTLVVRFLSEISDEVKVDKMGNVIAIKKGKEEYPKILLAAHMDEVGFIVTHIDDDGFLRFTPLGGLLPHVLSGQQVTIISDNKKVPGYIGIKPPHLMSEEERKKPIEIDNMFIDVGAQSAEEAHKMGIHIGSVGTFSTKFKKLTSKKVLGKAFDDRAGLTAIIQTFYNLKDSDYNIVAVATVQEEVGLRGAKVAAWQTNVDYAIVLEGTTAADTPESNTHKRSTVQCKGPAITVADKSIIVPAYIVRTLTEIAEKYNIPYQFKQTISGGTDAGAIHLTKEGIPAGVISIPCRYIHSAASILCIDDLKNTIKLVEAFIKEISETPSNKNYK